MAVSFKKEVILEAIQEVLAEDQKIPVRVSSKSDPSDPGSVEVMDRDKMNALKRTGKVEVDPMEEDHHENPNDDSDMAKSQLYAIAKYAIELLQLIKDGDQLDAWVQAKITKASDYIDAVQHYLEGEEYLDANQGESEEELAEANFDPRLEKGDQVHTATPDNKLKEGDYEPRTKEDLVFQYLRDAWQFGATKGKDVNPDEELSTMADSLLANLPDYDAAELDEIKKAEFEKIKPGKELQLRGYGVVKVIENDGIVMKIKDSLDKVHTINLGQYNEKFLKEDDDVEPSKKDIKAAEKETGGKKTHFTPEAQNMHNIIKNKVTKIEKKVEAGDDYKLDLAALKQYISKPEVRKALGAKHIKGMVSSIISERITEGVSCCGRCGRVHESAQDCKKPYISKDSPRHCKNKK